MSTVVVKIGGGALSGEALSGIREVLSGGSQLALVHGGGPELTRMLETLHIPTRFHQGLRVTDEAVIQVAEMVFAGQVNKGLVRELYTLGVQAVGISGTDGPTLHVKAVPGLGRVGEVTHVDPSLIHTLWQGGFVPVMAPLGLGPEGAYNVNGDAAAAALAPALGAEHLLLLTDVDGLLENGATVPSLAPEECERYVENGLAFGGMIPKLRAAAEAARSGVRVRIVNGKRPGSLTRALAGEPVGTLISEGVAA